MGLSLAASRKSKAIIFLNYVQTCSTWTARFSLSVVGGVKHVHGEQRRSSRLRASCLCQTHSVSAGSSLHYSKWHVYMLITISAKPCTVTLPFTDDLNYLHNYILSSLLQFVSCGISSSQRAKSLKWTRHVLDGSVGWAHSNPAERGKCNVTAVLTPRDTWISAKPRSLDAALGSERKHAPSSPRLHFPLSLLIVQY